jgi:hypothetical protein
MSYNMRGVVRKLQHEGSSVKKTTTSENDNTWRVAMREETIQKEVAREEQCKERQREEHREKSNIIGAMWNKKLETKN